MITVKLIGLFIAMIAIAALSLAASSIGVAHAGQPYPCINNTTSPACQQASKTKPVTTNVGGQQVVTGVQAPGHTPGVTTLPATGAGRPASPDRQLIPIAFAALVILAAGLALRFRPTSPN